MTSYPVQVSVPPQGGAVVPVTQHVNLPSDGNYDDILVIGTQGVGRLTVTGQLTRGGPLTGIAVTFAANPGGIHTVALKDSDFTTATDTLLRALGLASPTNITPGSIFQFTLDLFGAVAEVKLQLKTSNPIAQAQFEVCGTKA